MIVQLKDMINEPGDAVLIVPVVFGATFNVVKNTNQNFINNYNYFK
mgnify:CR=1 FL=1